MSVATAPPARTGDHRAPQSTLRPRGETVVQLVVLGVVCGALSLIDALPGFVRLCLVFAFVALAPGNAMLMWWRGLSRAARTGLPPALGLALVTLATTLEADVKWWHPGTTVLLLGAASLISVGVRLVIGGRADDISVDAVPDTVPDDVADATASPDDAPAPSRAGRWIVPGLLGLAAIAWATSLPTIGSAKPSAYGLLAAAAPGYAISIVLVAVAGLVAIARRSIIGMFGATAGVIVIEHLSVTLATSVPIYPWTYKHIGVVDYIDRYGYVVRGTDIYHNWPGLFTTTAFVHDLTGIDVITLAHWFTPVYHVALVALVYAAARAWRRTPVIAAATAFVFEACSFVAQDYFSPQALGYLLGIAVLLVLGESAHRRQAAIPGLVIFAALTVTHQLTPYWLIIVTAALVVLRRVKSWWLPVAFAAIAGSFLLWNYTTVKEYGAVSSGGPLANIRLRAIAEPLFGIRTQFYATAVVYVVLYIGTAVLMLVALRRHSEWRAPSALALSPPLILAVQGYGGEGIFRVMLYSLPGLAAVMASALVWATRKVTLRTFVAGTLAMVTILASAHAFLGSFSAYRVTRGEVDAWRAFNSTAPVPARIYSVGPGFPGNPQWPYVTRITQDPYYSLVLFGISTTVSSNFSNERDYEEFMSIIEAVRDPAVPLYVVTSTHSQTYGHLYGVLPADATRNLERRMAADPRWSTAYKNDTTVLFRLTNRPGN